LQGTDELLSQISEGPFFCGSTLSAADVAWAPFLERYRYQLPCLHEGLDPYNAKDYPNLAAWYDAMDRLPAYACRVKGDASSWRKVLSMAGFGNAGVVPPQIEANMNEMARQEALTAEITIDQGLWTEYTASRPYLAATPQAEAAAIITRNREAISVDVLERAGGSALKGLPTTESDLDVALRALVCVLLENDEDAKSTLGVGALATFLDERMCVPRDMGAMSASAIKKLALELSA
jgi:glutathione S-transferase